MEENEKKEPIQSSEEPADNVQSAETDKESVSADTDKTETNEAESYTVDDKYKKEAPFENTEGSFDSRTQAGTEDRSSANNNSNSDRNYNGNNGYNGYNSYGGYGGGYYGGYNRYNGYGNNNGYGQSPYNGNGYYQGAPYQQPMQPQKPKKSKAPIIAACTFLAVFVLAVAFLFGYFYVEYVLPVVDGITDGDGTGSGEGNGGSQGSGGSGSGSQSGGVASNGTITQDGFDITQAETPGTSYASLADAYEATHKSFVEINSVTSEGVSAGSGVIIARMANNAGYYIVTNHHVVEDATQINVKAYCGNEYKEYTAHATVLSDEISDLAVIAIMETSEMQIAKVGSSSNLRVGEAVYVIGNPLGTLAGTMTDGIISAQAVDIFVGDHYMTLLQTNTAINPGNSGGPMFNMAGELVGIVNAKYADVSVEGIGFAIPIDTAVPLVEQMISKGYIEGRHNLGISVEYGYYGAGLWITEIESDSALRDTDLTIANGYAYRIESINGNVFESTSAANIYIDEQLKAGQTVKLNISVYQVYFNQLKYIETKQLSITLEQAYAS